MGVCPYHKQCLEGLVSNKSLAQRLNIQPSELPKLEDSHEIWELFSHYMAVYCVQLNYVLAPDVIVLGGGIMQRKVLLEKIRNKFVEMLGNYYFDKQVEDLENYIAGESFQNKAGLFGALLLALNS